MTDYEDRKFRRNFKRAADAIEHAKHAKPGEKLKARKELIKAFQTIVAEYPKELEKVGYELVEFISGMGS